MRFARFLFCSALLGALAGCAGSATSVDTTTADVVTPPPAAPASGPQTRIAVGAFDYRGMQGGDIGQGLAGMLAAALLDSGRFVQATAGPDGLAADAQWLIQGSVTAFEPSCSAGSSIIVSGNQACMGLNLKIVDAASGRVIRAVVVDGSSDGSAGGLDHAHGALPPALAGYARMPMELAIRSCVDKAVKAIAAAAP